MIIFDDFFCDCSKLSYGVNGFLKYGLIVDFPTKGTRCSDMVELHGIMTKRFPRTLSQKKSVQNSRDLKYTSTVSFVDTFLVCLSPSRVTIQFSVQLDFELSQNETNIHLPILALNVSKLTLITLNRKIDKCIQRNSLCNVVT